MFPAVKMLALMRLLLMWEYAKVGTSMGEYRLTAEDLLTAKVPEDRVFIAANSVDVHGRFGPKSNEYMSMKGSYYGIPFRSLLPLKVENLLITGRCVSADSTGAGAIRVMPPCVAMGQAAGTAAALAVKTGCSVHLLDIKILQNKLRENGVFLPNVKRNI